MQTILAKPLSTINDMRVAGARLVSTLPNQAFVYGLHIFYAAGLIPLPSTDAGIQGRFLDMPGSVRELSFAEAVDDRDIGPVVMAALAERFTAADLIAARHFAGLTAFRVVVVPKGICAMEPIRIAPGSAGNVSIVVIAKRGASVTVVEEMRAEVTSSFCVDLVVEEDAMITYASSASVKSGTACYVRRSAHVAARGAIVWQEAAAAGGFLFSRTSTSLDGLAASTSHAAASFSNGGKIDAYVETRHAAPRTASSSVVRTVLAGNAKGIVRGLAMIPTTINGCSASQKNDTLLLGDRAEIDAIPNLEIGTGDVAASHAASAGPVDADRLFYLMSRGIGRSDAEVLIATGFVAAAMNGWSESAKELFLASFTKHFS